MTARVRADVPAASRVVVKVGSSSISGDGAFRIDLIVAALAGARERGVEVVLVSSGAIATALPLLDLRGRPNDLATQQAAAAAGDDAIFLALSIETDLDTDQVADYAKDNGFDDIRFAVMSPEMLAAMNDAYGKSALNAPSTPKIVVAADGTAGELETGFESPDEIAATLSEVS